MTVLPLFRKKRIWELDFLKGLAIFLMVFDHIMFDFTSLPYMFNGYADVLGGGLMHSINLARWYWNAGFRMSLHYFFAFIFLFITGISCSLTHSNIMRAIKTGAAAMVISIVTYEIDMFSSAGVFVLFGVLQCMTAAILFYVFIKAVFKSDYVVLLFGAALILGGILIKWYDKPFIYYIDGNKDILDIILGIKRYGGDHFGIFPSAGVVLVGAFFGSRVYGGKKSRLPRLNGSWNNAFCFMGKNVLWVYVLHQPVIMLLMLIIGTAVGLEVSI